MRAFLCVVLVLLFQLCTFAQQPSTTADNPTAPSTPQGEAKPSASGNQKLTESEPNTLVSDQRIPSGARVYIAPMMNGFDIYVTAALQKKKVPVVLVAVDPIPSAHALRTLLTNPQNDGVSDNPGKQA
jgi:hypothetical protein